METMAALKQSVVDYLARHGAGGALQQARLVCEYPDMVRAYPLKQPVVAVGVESVALSDGGMGGYYGERGDGSASCYGKAAVVTMYFDIHCPPSQGGEGCHRLYEALCDLLLLGDCPYGFYRMHCDGIGYDKDTAANRLRATATLRGAVTKADTGMTVREFDVRSDLIHDNK